MKRIVFIHLFSRAQDSNGCSNDFYLTQQLSTNWCLMVTERGLTSGGQRHRVAGIGAQCLHMRQIYHGIVKWMGAQSIDVATQIFAQQPLFTLVIIGVSVHVCTRVHFSWILLQPLIIVTLQGIFGISDKIHKVNMKIDGILHQKVDIFFYMKTFRVCVILLS